jgi:hypothetical protein
MMHTARAVVMTLGGFVALGSCSLFAVACRGGPDTSADAGVEASSEPSSGDVRPSGADAACATALVTIDDVEATESARGGGPACLNDDDCVVRFAGDYCACPSTPRPIAKSRVAAFDERLAGITARCTCEIRPCLPPAPPKVQCVLGACVLGGGGGE